MAPAPTPTPPTPTPIHELDPVVLTADLPDHGLAIGALGTVAKVLEDGASFEVDFTATGGPAATAATVTVTARRDQLRRSTGEDG